MTKFEGGCLCGAVRYEGSEPQGGGHCYCEDCRRTSGSSHCSHMIVAETAFSVSGDVRFFDKPSDSGSNVSRGFCPNCGSAVYSRNSGMPGVVFVRASSLDDPNVFEPAMVVYTKRKPTWSDGMSKLPSFSGMPKQEDMPPMEA